jgi:hypothetical protein
MKVICRSQTLAVSPRSKSQRCPLTKKLGGPYDQSGWFGEARKSLASAQDSNHDSALVHFTASHYTDWNIIVSFKVNVSQNEVK